LNLPEPSFKQINIPVMKKYRLIFLLAVSLSGSALLRAQVAINAGGAGADPSAALDVSFPDKGLLPPRVALQSALLPDPVVSPAGGLIVYNTATAGTPPGNVIPGFYYWMGGRWNAMSLPAGTAAGDLVYWNGNQWVSVSPGLPGQFLRMSQEGLPYWTGSAFPTVTTRDTSGNITQNSASSGGEVTSDGGASVYSRGVCWDTVSNPVAGGNHTSDGSGVGAFTSSITGLSSGTTYHVRAYATNNIGTSYGSDVTFTTQEYIAPPTVEPPASPTSPVPLLPAAATSPLPVAPRSQPGESAGVLPPVPRSPTTTPPMVPAPEPSPVPSPVCSPPPCTMYALMPPTAEEPPTAGNYSSPRPLDPADHPVPERPP